jgi:hypothetical protein
VADRADAVREAKASLTNPKRKRGRIPVDMAEPTVTSVPFPSWDGTNECQRVWKRALARTGKQPVFDILTPHVRELVLAVRNAAPPATNQGERFPGIDARVEIVLNALDEIAVGERAVDSLIPVGLTMGLAPEARWPLEAVSYLIIAAAASEHFEKDVMMALGVFAPHRIDVLENVRVQLNRHARDV